LFTKVERIISYRNLKPKKKEGFLKVISIFSFLGIMLGVSILIIVMSVMNGFRADLTNKILGLNPHLVIEPSGNKISQSFYENLIIKYKDFKFSRSINGEAVILSNDTAKGILVKGIEHKDINKLLLNNEKFKGNHFKFGKGKAFIGGELAFNLNLEIGDKINLMSSFFMSTPIGGVPKQESFVIVGIFNSGFYEFDQNLIYIDLKDSLSLFEKEKEDINIEIYLNDPLKANFFKKEIQKLNENLFVYSWSDLNKSFFSALKVERNVMFIILTLIIIVAAFNIISGLTILIKNKTREIAILKTLGFSNKSIKKTFFLTGFTIGFSATILGIFVGTIFSIYIEKIRLFFSEFLNINIFPSDVYFLEEMPSDVNFTSILIIFTFSLLITALASYFPARTISKMNPTTALKYE